MLSTLALCTSAVQFFSSPAYAVSIPSKLDTRQTDLINTTLPAAGGTPGLDPEPFKPRNITTGAFGWSTPTTLDLDDDIYISVDPYEAPTGCKEYLQDSIILSKSTETMHEGLLMLEKTILESMEGSDSEYFWTPYTSEDDEAINVSWLSGFGNCAMNFTMRAIYGPGSADEVQFPKSLVTKAVNGMNELLADGRQATGSFVFSLWSRSSELSYGGGAVAYVSPLNSTFLLGDEQDEY
ncbi:MAG: hypothetical protein Q9174_003239 [Haloplaca sp. 1 TL-2023]